jgi:phage regulator Rha-like protein
MARKMSLTTAENVEQLIFLIRGHKVMLSMDLAELYGVEPKVLIQAVKRNAERFPRDFMLQLSAKEFENLKSQIVTSSWGGIRRAMPYAFTEQGVAMLSSVLHSKRAVQVNIEIMRAFVRLRQTLAAYKELDQKLKELERHIRDHDDQIVAIFEAIRQLMTPPETTRKKIRFEVKESGAIYGKRRTKGSLKEIHGGNA